MSKIEWDASGEKLYETGVKQGVLYKAGSGASAGTYPNGVAWNGLTGVTEKPTGAEATAIYADDIKYLNLISAEEFEGTIEAYMYPDEFAECDGSAEIAEGVTIGQQNRQTFGFSYSTVLGNDEENNGHGYKLHLLYGCVAAPSEKAYTTINDSPEAITFSWELKTTPVNVPNVGGKKLKPTANITIDSTKVDPVKLADLEAVLYGVDAEEFSAEKTYFVGDYVTHDTTTYRCTTAVTTPGAWSANNWTALTVVPGPRLPLPAEVIQICGSTSNLAG